MPLLLVSKSVENGDNTHRIDDLRECGNPNKVVSFEPLIGPVGDLVLTDIGWVQIGGESGPVDAIRPMDDAWAVDIIRQCQDAGESAKKKADVRPMEAA